MNMALDGETPYDNANLFGFLMRHMAVMESVSNMKYKYAVYSDTMSQNLNNSAFYTTDGMRFEFRQYSTSSWRFPLYETDTTKVCIGGTTGS